MAKYSYNGVILQERPATAGYQLIYRGTDGFYYLTISSSPVKIFNGYLSVFYGDVIEVYVTSKNADTWYSVSVGLGDTAVYTYIASSSQYKWSNHDIHLITSKVDTDGNVIETTTGLGFNGSEPILQKEEARVLEARVNKYITNTYGSTGIYVGAQVRDTATGKVTDISDQAEYFIDVFASPYAYLDANRQLIISSDCPWSGISVYITWDELPDQRVGVPIFVKIDSGDSGGESGGNTGGSGGGETETPQVTNIVITGCPYSVDPGKSFTVGVIVSGTGDYNKAFTASLGGSTSSKTYCVVDSNEITVYVGEDDQTDYLNLTVTSVQDSAYKATKRIFVNHADTPVFNQNLPFPNVFTYELGETPDTFGIVASVSDGGTLTYQWYKIENGTVSEIEGATTPNYTPPIDKISSRLYYCIVTNTTASGLIAKACSTEISIVVIPSTLKLGIAVGLSLKGYYDPK